jgi:thiamine biosynthesis lipoprotein
MGTICNISLDEGSSESIYTGAFDLLSDIDTNLSRTKEGSLIYTLNKEGHVTIDNDDYFDLIVRSFELAQTTDGVFDPSIGEAVALWGIGTENERIPSQEELDAVNDDYTQVVIDKGTHTITIPKGMEVDLGAIGKGYATDQLIAYFAEKGVNRGIINLGGNVYVIGSKDEGTPWKIGLQKPFDQRGDSFVLLSLSDTAVVTSGAYERYFEKDGTIYCHILDPKTLYPAQTDIQSSTIIGPDATLCDALSTTCFILGKEKALALLDTAFPEVSALFLLSDNSIVTTPQFPYAYQEIAL